MLDFEFLVPIKYLFITETSIYICVYDIFGVYITIFLICRNSMYNPEFHHN